MPAPEVRAVGTVAAGTGAVSPGLPAGTVAGDLLVMVAESKGEEGALSAEGWKSAPGSPQVTGNTRLTVLYKIAVGGDATTTNDPGDHQLARIVGIKKGTFNELAPFNINASGTQAATKAVSIPGATTLAAECLILAIASGSLPDSTSTTQFGAATNASLTSITEQIDNTTAEGDGGAIYCVSGVKAAAGAYNATTCAATTEAVRGVISLAICPPGDGVRQKAQASSEAGAKSLKAVLTTTARTGKLLVSGIATSKDAGSNPAPSEGWTLVPGSASHSASVSVAMAYRVADGSAKDECTWSWTNSVSCAAWILESDRSFASVFNVVVSTNFTTEATVTEVPLGAATAIGDGLAVGMVGLDHTDTWDSGATCATWDGGFTEKLYYRSEFFNAGGSLSYKTTTNKDSVSTTPTALQSAEQASGILVLFGEPAPAEIPLAASSGAASATLALSAATQIPLAASSGVASATLTLTAPTKVTLAAASGVASATLTLMAPTQIPLAASSGVASASLSMKVTTQIPLGASSGISSTSLALHAPTLVPLAASSGVASASLAIEFVKPALMALAAASGKASATLMIRVPREVVLAPSTGTATATALIRIQYSPGFYVKLGGEWKPVSV